MAVYDRWHRDPRPGDESCKCGTRRTPLYPAAGHLTGDRWQVRWRDPAGKQCKRNFGLKVGSNADLNADAFDAKISREIDTGAYVDPRSAQITLRDYAETWRKSRRIPNPQTAARLERTLRLHVYEGEPGSGKTPQGAPAIGQHPVGLLAARPSLVAAWAAGIPLAPAPARQVMGRVSKVFRAMIDDGIVGRDPTRLEAVDWPGAGPGKARAWSLAQLEAMRGELPARWRVMLDLGAGAGLRQGEMLGLGADDIDWLKRGDPRVRIVRQLQHVGGKAVFRPVKNRTPHSVPLSPLVHERLSAHLDRFPAVTVTLPWDDPGDRERHGKPVTVRLIITAPGGNPAWGTTLSGTWRAAGRRAEVTPEGEREREDGCHALRHTFASAQLRAGVDIVRVAAWLGDTVEMVASTYAHMMPGRDDNDGRAAVDAFLGAPQVPSALDVPSEAVP
jgi:hypothetical protein